MPQFGPRELVLKGWRPGVIATALYSAFLVITAAFYIPMVMWRLPASFTQPKDRQQGDRRARSTFEFHRPVFSSRRQETIKLGKSFEPQDQVLSIAKKKRSKYAHVRPPAPLANDLAILQFTGGGNTEIYIKHMMTQQAKAAGGSKGMVVGVADVYRDSDGVIWWDEDEEVEYAHLLDDVDKDKAEDAAGEALWEDFGASPVSSATTKSRFGNHGWHSRTESTSSADSDLDLRYLIPLPELDSYSTFTSGELNDRVLAVTRLVDGENKDPLSLPSRPSRQARHLLLRPVSLSDLQAFGNTQEARFSSLSCTADRTSADQSQVRPDHEPKGLRRRMLPPNRDSASGPPRNLQSGSPSEVDAIRQQFIKDSFAPATISINTVPAQRFQAVSSSMSSKGSGSGTQKVARYSSVFSIPALFNKI